MMRTILRILEWTARCPTEAEEKYNRAMQASADLLRRIRGDRSNDAARTVVLDIIANRHNAPYMTTVFEAVEEVNAPLKQMNQRS